MKAVVFLLNGIAGFSTIAGGCLLAIVHQDITGISMHMIPFGVRFLVYPLAVLTYLAGSCMCLFACFCRSKKHLCFFCGTVIVLLSMVLLLVTWVLIIRLYALPLGTDG